MHQSHRILARLLPSLALAFVLCSCSLLIPENPSAPRYNSVLGGPRRPELNPTASGGDSQSMNHHAAPAADPSQQAYEPTSFAAPADQITSNEVPPPAAMVTSQSPYSGRQMPAENQYAGNYPALQSVPPSNTDPKEVGRLNAIRSQLESDRDAAAADKAKLNNDAISEPSLIGTQPPSPVSQPQSMLTPSGSVALPPPPPPLASSPNYNPMASYRSVPVQNASLEPIVLHPPSANSTPLPPPQLSYTPSLPLPAGNNTQAMAPATSDGFNPMAGSGAYASNGSYLPDSRYAHNYQ